MFGVRDENRHGFVINVTYAARGEEAAEWPLFYTAKVIYHKFRQIHTERLIKCFIIGAARRPIIISGVSCAFPRSRVIR